MSRRSPCACFPLWLGLPLFGVLFACGSVASGQFTTVINLPGDPVPTSISAGTQLNILDGAHIDSPPHTFTAFGGEVNVSGGTINTAFVATGDATTNVTEGHFTRSFILNEMSQATISGGLFDGSGSFQLNSQSLLQISGGEFHRSLQAAGDSQAMISGGRVFGVLSLQNRATATLSGGLFVSPHHTLSQESSLLVQGGDFRLDGVPLDGLSTPGAQQEVQLDFGQYLTATLADGSPFELDLFTTEMPGRDFIHTDARLYLVLVHIPEPATLALAVCALATFATARRSAHDVRHSA